MYVYESHAIARASAMRRVMNSTHASAKQQEVCGSGWARSETHPVVLASGLPRAPPPLPCSTCVWT